MQNPKAEGRETIEGTNVVKVTGTIVPGARRRGMGPAGPTGVRRGS
ncbi:LppX_LprAFG lipoprotein [Nocardia farcinica]|nr:LppX_LprAFG lipoprotein [Nocardia farcinica]